MIGLTRRTILVTLALAGVAAAQEVPTSETGGSSIGPSVDRVGAPVIDPTRNVLDLVKALEKRMEEVKGLTDKNIDTRFTSMEKLIELENQIAKLNYDHNADNIRQNTASIELRAQYQAKLDDKETARVDAIQAVSQAAVKTEADRAQQAVTTLATAQAATAETLRAAVNTTATNIALQLDRTTSAIVDRIAQLEKAQYTGAGRAGVADPQVEALRADVARLTSTYAQGAGKTEGVGLSWQVLVAVVGIGIAVVVMTRKNSA